jgi:hypothetical protein
LSYSDEEEPAVFNMNNSENVASQNSSNDVVSTVTGPSLNQPAAGVWTDNPVEFHTNLTLPVVNLQTEDTEEGTSYHVPATGTQNKNYAPDSGSSGGQAKFGGPPGFVTNLIVNFHKHVTDYLDHNSKEAVKGQMELVDPAKFGKVKMAVVNRVMDLLLEHGDGKTVPGTKFFDSVVDVLGAKYPAVFGPDPTTMLNGVRVRMFSTRGTGGINGIKGKYANYLLKSILLS